MASIAPGFAAQAREAARWLVPALGCFLMAAATLVNTAPHHVAAQGGALVDQAMAFSIAAHHSGVNNAPARTLEWTFERASTSTGDSFSHVETNLLSK